MIVADKGEEVTDSLRFLIAFIKGFRYFFQPCFDFKLFFLVFPRHHLKIPLGDTLHDLILIERGKQPVKLRKAFVQLLLFFLHCLCFALVCFCEPLFYGSYCLFIIDRHIRKTVNIGKDGVEQIPRFYIVGSTFGFPVSGIIIA